MRFGVKKELKELIKKDYRSASCQCYRVVVEFNNFDDNNFTMLGSVFEDFNDEATDCFNNFWLEKAKVSHLKILAFAVKLVLTLFH